MLKYLSYKTRGLNHCISKITSSSFLLMALWLCSAWRCMPSDSTECTWRLYSIPPCAQFFMRWRELFHLLHQTIVFMHLSPSVQLYFYIFLLLCACSFYSSQSVRRLICATEMLHTWINTVQSRCRGAFSCVGSCLGFFTGEKYQTDCISDKLHTLRLLCTLLQTCEDWKNLSPRFFLASAMQNASALYLAPHF